MKRLTHLGIALFVVVVLLGNLTSCSKVPAGHVGIKLHLLGTSKGIDTEELSPGRYWIGWNEELYLFPTFTQNYVWTADKNEQSPTDESITFQTSEGMVVGADVGISYHILKNYVSSIFQRYRKGVDEITGVYLRNMVRDGFNQVGARNPVSAVYGSGKTKLLEDVQALVQSQVPEGIVIEKIYLIGKMQLPKEVVAALNRKIEATQKAEQRENELREAEADAAKKIAAAKGEAASILEVAKARASANRILAESITPELIKYEAVKAWNGELPRLLGSDSVIPMIDVDSKRVAKAD